MDDIAMPKSTLDLSGSISQEDFHKYIYSCFQDACLESNTRPTREMFQEVLETDKRFAGFIETMNKKFQFQGFDKKGIIDNCLKHIGA